MNNIAKRIPGFDMARAYAIFGMFVVNFNGVFGSYDNHQGLSGFLNLFNGNSSVIFVILAGMGVSLMTNKNAYLPEEKRKLQKIIIRRSWFLFALGLLFYLWWPADILHLYGGYMHIAVLFVFLPKKTFLFAGASAVIIFHILLFIIPYESGWNFDTFQYLDFWTLPGFLRNTFFNGWNPIFPWIAFFFLGMFLGRLNWHDPEILKRAFIIGLLVYTVILLLQVFANDITDDKDLILYITAEYLPPFIPFMLSTAAFGVMLISLFLTLGNKFSDTKIVKILTVTGRMTLTHYIAHLVLGLFILSLITGKTLDYDILDKSPSNPLVILIFSMGYFLFSCLFSYLWTKKYRHGPLETIMRWISG